MVWFDRFASSLPHGMDEDFQISSRNSTWINKSLHMYVSLEQEFIVISRSLIILTQPNSASHPEYHEMRCFTNEKMEVEDTKIQVLSYLPGQIYMPHKTQVLYGFTTLTFGTTEGWRLLYLINGFFVYTSSIGCLTSNREIIISRPGVLSAVTRP